MRENLVVLAQAFATANGISLTTVSKKIHGNGGFFADFLAGDISCGLNTYFAMIERFREGWPQGVKWPETRDIPRPMPPPQSYYAPPETIGDKLPRKARQ